MVTSISDRPDLAALPEGASVLKETSSRCGDCGTAAPALVYRTAENEVWLARQCPEHGRQDWRISADAQFYWLAQGPAGDCGAGCACRASDGAEAGSLGRNARQVTTEGPFETLSTCLALIEIVDSCNLSCPVCYADSPLGKGSGVQAHPLPELQARIEGVIARKGRIEILQLSGGEPTLHPEIGPLLEWAQRHPRIDYVLLNTNGVRFAGDAVFQKTIREVLRPGKLQLYLQFDGVQEAGQRELRGADLRGMRERTIAFCQEIGLPITLAMTVTRASLPHLWDAIAFGLGHPIVRGVSFQPEFLSGRNPTPIARDDQPISVADVILGAVGQSGGRLKTRDFTPLPCGDPNCAVIGYLIRIDGVVHSVSKFVDFAKLQSFLKDKMKYDLADLMQCGCENEPLGQLLKQFELDASNTFRLLIKPFMDARTWDEDRIARCCTHVIRPDGRLDSFCRYYSGQSG